MNTYTWFAISDRMVCLIHNATKQLTYIERYQAEAIYPEAS